MRNIRSDPTVRRIDRSFDRSTLSILQDKRDKNTFRFVWRSRDPKLTNNLKQVQRTFKYDPTSKRFMQLRDKRVLTRGTKAIPFKPFAHIAHKSLVDRIKQDGISIAEVAVKTPEFRRFFNRLLRKVDADKNNRLHVSELTRFIKTADHVDLRAFQKAYKIEPRKLTDNATGYESGERLAKLLVLNPDHLQNYLTHKRMRNGYTEKELGQILGKTPEDARRFLDENGIRNGQMNPRAKFMSYKDLYAGNASEHVYAFGGDRQNPHLGMAQYTAFRATVEAAGFQRVAVDPPVDREGKPYEIGRGVDDTGHALYKRAFKIPGGREHTLYIRVVGQGGSYFTPQESMVDVVGAAEHTFMDNGKQVTAKRTTIVSVSHADHGAGMKYGSGRVHPSGVILQKAPVEDRGDRTKVTDSGLHVKEPKVLIVSLACQSNKYFVPPVTRNAKSYGVSLRKTSLGGAFKELEMNAAPDVAREFFTQVMPPTGKMTRARKKEWGSYVWRMRNMDNAYQEIAGSFTNTGNEDALFRMNGEAAVPVVGFWDGATGKDVQLPLKKATTFGDYMDFFNVVNAPKPGHGKRRNHTPLSNMGSQLR